MRQMDHPTRRNAEFQREYSMLAKLHHPNIVTFYGISEDQVCTNQTRLRLRCAYGKHCRNIRSSLSRTRHNQSSNCC